MSFGPMKKMRVMITFDRPDVVLVRFVFTDESQSKLRPVVVLSTSEYHKGRREMIVAAVTSNVKRLLPGDCVAENWKEAGLLRPSVVTGIIRTVKQSMVDRRLGRLTARDFETVQAQLRRVLGF